TYPGVNASSSYDVVRDFDRFGRVQQIEYNDGAPIFSVPTVQFDHDILGNRLKMTEGNVSRNTYYSYDKANRLNQVGYDTDGDQVVENLLQYTYDIRGLRTQLDVDGNTTNYGYDAKGRLTGIEDWDDQVSTFHYDNLNRQIVTLRPNGLRSH